MWSQVVPLSDAISNNSPSFHPPSCTTLTITSSFAVTPLSCNVTTGWTDRTSHEDHSWSVSTPQLQWHNHMVFLFTQGAKKEENIHKHGNTTKEGKPRPARQQPKKVKIPYSGERTEGWRQHKPTRRIKENIECQQKYNK